MEPRRFIVDVDSTITDHWRRIRQHTMPHWPGLSIRPSAFEEASVMKDQILPGCLDVLWRAQHDGFEVSYLTARGWDKLGDITRRQLEGFRLPNPERVQIVSTLTDKIVLLRKHSPCYYVDDFWTGQEKSIGTFHQDVAMTIRALGINVIVFRNDWEDVWQQVQCYEGDK